MEDTSFFDEIKTTALYSGELCHRLFCKIRDDKSLEGIKAHHHAEISRVGVVKLMILMKLLKINSIHQYITSDLSGLMSFGKDVLYRIKNNAKMNWRGYLLSSAFGFCQPEREGKSKLSPHEIPCFILDDTDLPKTGKHIEFIGRIFSHVKRSSILGFKSLNLAMWTGANLLHVDFSLHGELGKKADQGMGKKDIARRYQKDRRAEHAGNKRSEEYFEKKTIMAIQMIRRAIRKGFTAKYILVDSWFFNQNLVQLAIDKGVDLISRPKNNNWQYICKGKSYTRSKLANKFRSLKSRKVWKQMGLYYGEVRVEFKGYPIKLFFFKSSKRGSKWQVLTSTNLKIGAKTAYQIYQNRWSIEVSYKELKQHLQYGGCQSRDFDGQIADATQCLPAYNYLSKHKAVHEYETIGGLFTEISQTWLRPTIMQQFWNKVIKLIKKMARFLDVPIQKLRDINPAEII